MKAQENLRIASLAAFVLAWDQITKWLVLRYLLSGAEKVVLPGFFKLVHWTNTGAAWSMFHGNNGALAIVAIVALFVLIAVRHHFDPHTLGGQLSLGCIFGGILGNLIDRVYRDHVVDFLYFYVTRRDGLDAGFPAFNIADTAICIGVGLLLIQSWQEERNPAVADQR